MQNRSGQKRSWTNPILIPVAIFLFWGGMLLMFLGIGSGSMLFLALSTVALIVAVWMLMGLLQGPHRSMRD